MAVIGEPFVKKGKLITLGSDKNTPLGDNFFLVKGKYPNKTDNVDVGPNNKKGMSLDNNEIGQIISNDANYKNGGSTETVRIFSAQPILGGISPAQLLYRGMPADKVFAMQEQYKRIHRLNSDGTHYVNGGNPQTILTNPISSLWNKIKIAYYTYFKEPKDYSKEEANTKECAEYSNKEVSKLVKKPIYGDAWTRNNAARYKQGNKTVKIYSGYDGLTKPKEYSTKSYWNYLNAAAKNIESKKDSLLNVVKTGDMVGLYYKTSPSTKKAFEKGEGGETHTHTGHIVVENETPYLYHNVHGDIKKNKLEETFGDNHHFGVVSIYRPKQYGGSEQINFKNGGIYIAPSKRGTFTAAAKKHGMSVQGFASQVLANKDNYSPAMVKKANFARNASKWKHLYGGEDTLINPLGERPNVNSNENMKNKRTKNDYGGNNNTPYTIVTTATGYNLKPNFVRTPIDFREAMHKASLNIIRARMQKEGIDAYINNQLNQLNNIGINKSSISDIYSDKNKRTKNSYGNEFSYIENQLPIGAAINLDNPLKFNFNPTTIGGKITQYNNFLNNAKKSPLYKASIVETPSSTSTENIATNIANTNINKGIGLPAWGADLINMGINVIGSGINWGLRNNYAKSLKYNPLTYTLLAPKKLKTKINIAPQLAQMRENAAKYEDAINRNTASSRTALNRIGNIRNQTLLSSMDLYGKKENAETELINKDLLNQQNVANQNAQNIQNIVNQNIKGYTDIENQRAGIKTQNNVDFANNLASAVSMPLNRYIGRQSAAANMATTMLANPEAAKLIGGDKWKQAYNQIMGLIG